VAQPNPVPPINDLMDVLIEESPSEWVRDEFVEKFRNRMEGTLSQYGFVSDEHLSATLRILDRLPITDWLSDDEWHSADTIDYLRGLSSDQRRSLSVADRECLERILQKLPPLPPHKPEPIDSASDSPADPQPPDETKKE
jgi:hypothetical protein